MKNNTSEKIVQFIGQKGQISVKEITNYLGISKQAVFKHLARLLHEGKINKTGKPPIVFYSIALQKYEGTEHSAPEAIKNFIEKRFFNITPAGEIKTGWQGFSEWCSKRGQEISKSAADYVDILSKYDKIRKNGLIDGIGKMKSTFPIVHLDHLFYVDFYSVERFGKTKLGKILLYAKQSQDKKMIKMISTEVRFYVEKLIEKYKISAIVFVPPTVKREIQFMKELENNLNLNLPKINIAKIRTEVVVPQKTLNKLEDRIENAKGTFFIEEAKKYKNILLIDDAVGSGATFNEIALKIKNKGIASGKIIGLAITGSLKGFDVISEV
jgi:hypoxanthine-guanine phosphoribosyltransferase